MTATEQNFLSRLADPAVVADPYPLMAMIREASPYPTLDGALIVLGRHADCSRILRDARVSSQRGTSRLAGANAPRRAAMSFLSMDPPDHTRLRKLVSKAFTPRVIACLEPRIREVTDELLSAAAERHPDELELVSELAYPLPVRIICELLGVPASDHSRFAGWSARLAHSLQPNFGGADDDLADTVAAREEFTAYFRELIAARRADPGDDLLTELIRAEDEGSRLTETELVSTAILLLVAGHETTVGLIANAVRALLRHPDQLAALRADPGLAAGAVGESLRYDPPVQLTARVARGPIGIGELEAADGTLILLLLAATGRDPGAFTDPDRFDITRESNGRPGAGHLAFAAGPHFCLGAPLARLEAATARPGSPRRAGAPELADDGLHYKPNFNLRGPDRLLIRTTSLG